MRQEDRNGPANVSARVSDWLVERLALGELDAETANDVRRRLTAEGRSPDDVVAAVAASNREILNRVAAAPVVAEIRRRVARTEHATARPAPRRRVLVWALPLLLAGGAAMIPFMLSTERTKGPAPSPAARLYVYRQGGAGGAERLRDGAHAARGDLLQLAYRTGAGGYGVLLSIDGAGGVTLHWPERKDGAAAPLQAPNETRLPSSFEVDDAPAFERFFLVRAAVAFPISTALDAARALAAQPSARRPLLSLPAGFEQVSLTVDKTRPATKELP